PRLEVYRRRNLGKGRDWIHAALTSESRFLIELRVGPRTLETAAQLVASVAMVCCVGGRLLRTLLLLIDDHLPYPSAILQVLGLVRHHRRRRWPPQRGRRGSSRRGSSR